MNPQNVINAWEQFNQESDAMPQVVDSTMNHGTEALIKAWLREGMSDRQISRRLKTAGITRHDVGLIRAKRWLWRQI